MRSATTLLIANIIGGVPEAGMVAVKQFFGPVGVILTMLALTVSGIIMLLNPVNEYWLESLLFLATVVLAALLFSALNRRNMQTAVAIPPASSQGSP